jgi:glutamate-1-semialdehyde 2,1-aminomutase
VARGFTGRDKFIKIEGCYHGHGDSFLIAAGSGALTFGSPDSPGVTKGTAKDTLIAPFNNLSAIKDIIAKNENEIAAIILEPVVGNMGCVLPQQGFLQGLRSLCDEHKIILIFDEVMTGFRLSLGGAQELYNVKPDLTTLGKIIGGGLPVGAYGGRKEIMDSISPVGPVYQAGTLSGNPLAMGAGLAMLRHLKQNPQIYQELDQRTTKLAEEIKKQYESEGLRYTINQVGSMFTLFFTDSPVKDFDSAKTSDTKRFASYFQSMLQQGIYLAPSQFEAMFISAAINDPIIDQILQASKKALKNVTVSV